MGFQHYCPLVCVVFISILHFITTQNAPVDDGNATSKPQDYVNAHNVVRREHGLGPVTWNATIAIYAQNYAEKRKADCALIHSMGNQGYAESIAIGGTAKDAVTMWSSEKPYYDPVSKTCAPGKVCGHYLQLIAKEGIQIGCGRVKCANNQLAYFVICDYWQPPAR